MTRERAIEVLKAWDLNCSDEFTANEFEQAFAMAIKALEQEPFINKPCVSSGVCEHDKQKILDKIRAEIEQITDTMGVSYNQYVSKIDVLRIIDKYKAESEG